MAGQRVTLAVNPGSTSTKLAIAREGTIVDRETIRHDAAFLKSFSTIWDQFNARLALCEAWSFPRLSECTAVVTLGGLFKPVAGGVYKVNDAMLADARGNVQGEHASNLGCALAAALAKKHSACVYAVDPVSVNEFGPLAPYSGHPAISRRSLSHALNIHAAARRAADQCEVPLASSIFIIAHLGGGISVAPVVGGRIVDVNDAASDGPFSPERTGGLPLQQVIGLCYSGKYSEREMRSFVMGRGGLTAYLGTNSVEEAEERSRTDACAAEVFAAMAYQIAKEIGAMATVVKGKVDAIVLTGGAARSTMLTSLIRERIAFLAPVLIDQREDEMQALVDAVVRVEEGTEQLREYSV